MKTKTVKMNRLLSVLVALGCLQWCQGQPLPFLNLDFEVAYLPTIPRDQYGSWVPISQGLPHWSAFLGSDPITQVLHNNVTLGSAAIWIWGPDWPGLRIEGNFTVVLAAGTASSGPPLSISQTGIVPHDSQWLLFKAGVPDRPNVGFGVFLNGENIPVTVLGTQPGYSVYGGEISRFAGAEATLTFSVYRSLNNALILDSIEFSPVPEPGQMGLLALGLAVRALASRRRARGSL